MGAYRTVIGVNFNQYIDNTTSPDRYLILDTQDDKQVTASAQIASQPLQDGDTMSDHMYREPVTVSLSGSFSLNGKNWNDDSYNFISKGDRLTNIQEAFETILNEGLLCTLTTINEEDLQYTSQNGYGVKSDARNRFKIRKNMALKSINWTESQNTVKYTFNFNEVIMVETQAEYEPLSEAELQEFGLPNVNYPQGSNLGNIMVESGQLPESIIKTLYENEYMTARFIEEAADTMSAVLGVTIGAALVTVGVCFGIMAVSGAIAASAAAAAAAAAATAAATAAAAAGAGSLAITTTAGATAAVVPVGTIIVAAVIAVAATVLLVTHLVKKNKEKKEKERKRKIAFDLVNDSAEEGSIRLRNLIDDVTVALNKLNTGLTIYNINGNYEQQVVLNIANENYVIDFIKDNKGSKDHFEWSAKISYMDGNPVSTYNSWCPVSNMLDLNRNVNLWFKDKSLTYEVYLLNPSLDPELNDTQEKLNNVKEHLDSYSIWVSYGDVQEQIKKVAQTIDNALTSRGYY